MLAIGNVSRMLAPGGVFLHNEARPVLGEITEALGLQFEQSRHVVIATVRGAAPLSDSVWIHRRAGRSRRQLPVARLSGPEADELNLELYNVKRSPITPITI